VNFAYVKWFPGAFMAGTAHLSNEEVGAYIRLLCWQAQSTELPNDFDRLSRLADGMNADTWKSIRDKFMVDDDTGGLYNQRMRLEMLTASERVEKSKSAANKRWSKKKNANADADAYADAMPTHMPKKETKKETKKERNKEDQTIQIPAHTDDPHLCIEGLSPDDESYKVELARWAMHHGVTAVNAFILHRLIAERMGDSHKGKEWLVNLARNVESARVPAAYLRKTMKETFGRQ
jgi:uncharacterized protein YdaU (DUF1376 family)